MAIAVNVEGLEQAPVRSVRHAFLFTRMKMSFPTKGPGGAEQASPEILMTDEIFVKDAAKRWQALLKAMENKDTATMALGVSLWATMNVDRLLKIAGQRAGGPDA